MLPQTAPYLLDSEYGGSFIIAGLENSADVSVVWQPAPSIIMTVCLPDGVAFDMRASCLMEGMSVIAVMSLMNSTIIRSYN
jgi:hypothetical protein